jgi:excisionase family DNA binding protein
MSLDASLAEIVTAAILPLTEEVRGLKAEVAALRAASPPKYGTVKDAARILLCSEQTSRRKVDLGEIPSTRVGRAVRIDLTALRPLEPATVADLAREARERRE